MDGKVHSPEPTGLKTRHFPLFPGHTHPRRHRVLLVFSEKTYSGELCSDIVELEVHEDVHKPHIWFVGTVKWVAGWLILKRSLGLRLFTLGGVGHGGVEGCEVNVLTRVVLLWRKGGGRRGGREEGEWGKEGEE